MIETLRTLFGGSAHYRDRKAKAHHKPTWNWEVAARKAEDCLREVLPFLVCKKDQAELALLARSYVRRGAQSTTLEAAAGRQCQQEIKTNISLLKRA